jgi:hypothetical protein
MLFLPVGSYFGPARHSVHLQLSLGGRAAVIVLNDDRERGGQTNPPVPLHAVAPQSADADNVTI